MKDEKKSVISITVTAFICSLLLYIVSVLVS